MSSPDLNPEMLDDFFTEADEHLVNIRRVLQASEAVGDTTIDPKIVGELFHDFHSFKGISAIAGLEPGETLAHAGEDLLRLIRSGQVALDARGLNVLNSVARKLEDVVAAFRARRPLPGYDSLLADIKSFCPGESPSGAAAGTSAPVVNTAELTNQVHMAMSQGLKVWKYTFSPSQELTARKITINTIRDQLAKVGEILKSTPVVKGRGVIIFEFLIATKQAPKNSKAWEAKGVTIELMTQEPAPDLPPESSQPETTAATETGHNPFLAPSHVVRVNLRRLDDLLRIVGEMVIHRSRLEIQLAQLGAQGAHVDLSGVQEVNGMLGRSLREMREGIMRMRLIPISEIFSRLPFVVRDLMQQTGKKARLTVTGQETAIDKYLIEKLKDPLLHMVRNAFSHGIETMAERVARGKPEEATIELSASIVGDSVIIRVKDDGKGIATKAIVQRAKQLGLDLPGTIDNEAILQILCSPGFSTRQDADRTSGRGVGMAVVATAIQELGGKLSLESEEGKGTQFTLRLPLNVVIAETLLVSAAGQTCAVPQNSVREIFHATEADLRVADGIEMVSYRGGVLPVTRLAGLFHLKSNGSGVRCILVITTDRGSVGLLVEKVLGQREVVVRNFRDPLIQVAGVSGATELGDGKPVLILDSTALTAGNVRPPESLPFAPK